jgi:hypothetical protein
VVAVDPVARARVIPARRHVQVAHERPAAPDVQIRFGDVDAGVAALGQRDRPEVRPCAFPGFGVLELQAQRVDLDEGADGVFLDPFDPLGGCAVALGDCGLGGERVRAILRRLDTVAKFLN